MKKLTSLSLLTCLTISPWASAQLPLESHLYEDENKGLVRVNLAGNSLSEQQQAEVNALDKRITHYIEQASINKNVQDCVGIVRLDGQDNLSSACQDLLNKEITVLINDADDYLTSRQLKGLVAVPTFTNSFNDSDNQEDVYQFLKNLNEKTIEEIDKLKQEKVQIEQDAGAKSGETNKVQQGFGGFSLGSFGGGVDTKITFVRYNLHYSTNGSIPFYIMGTAQASDTQGADKVNQGVLGQNTGLVNFKFASDWNIGERWGKPNGNGFCDFTGADETLKGGCWANLQGGVKLVEYTDENEKTKNLGSIYVSGMLSMELPISDASLTRAGRLIAGLGLSGYYANTDKIAHLYPEFVDGEVGNVADLKEWYASVDAGFTFTIDKEFSVKYRLSKPLVNDEAFETISSISLTWQPE